MALESPSLYLESNTNQLLWFDGTYTTTLSANVDSGDPMYLNINGLGERPIVKASNLPKKPKSIKWL